MSEVNKLIETVAKDIFKYDGVTTQELKEILNTLRQTQLNDQAAIRRYSGYEQYINAQQQALRNIQAFSASNNSGWRVTNE